MNISINRGRPIVPVLCTKKIDEQPEFRLQSEDSERRLIELHFLLELRVRRVIARQNVERAIRDPFEQRRDIALALRSGGFIL